MITQTELQALLSYDATSTVQVLDKIHTAESFKELSDKIIEALQLMHPKENV